MREGRAAGMTMMHPFSEQSVLCSVYASGKICLSIINDCGWKPSITIKQVGTPDLTIRAYG